MLWTIEKCGRCLKRKKRAEPSFLYYKINVRLIWKPPEIVLPGHAAGYLDSSKSFSGPLSKTLVTLRFNLKLSLRE